VASSVPPAVSTVDKRADLTQLIIQLLRASSDSAGLEALFEQFRHRVEKNGRGLFVFNAMLKVVSVLKRDPGSDGISRVVRPAYDNSGSPLLHKRFIRYL
jgi:hypothetical protein